MGLSPNPGKSVSCLFVLKRNQKQGLKKKKIKFFHLYDPDAMARKIDDISVKALCLWASRKDLEAPKIMFCQICSYQKDDSCVQF